MDADFRRLLDLVHEKHRSFPRILRGLKAYVIHIQKLVS